MISDFSDVPFRLRFHPKNLVRMLIGIGCLRVILALAHGGPVGVSLAAAAAGWILCAVSLILLALWDGHIQEHHPGVSSFFRKLSYGAVAGSLLPCAAVSLLAFTGLGAAQAIAAALAGLALTLCSATLWEWLLKDIGLDAPPLSESVVMARLAAFQEIAAGSAWGMVSTEADGD
jgi:hypothetical protein